MGGFFKLKGYFTTVGWVKGHSIKNIESLLGLHNGRLIQGAKVFYALRLPTLSEFELRGFSQVADHRTNEEYGVNLNNPQNKYEKDAYLVKKKLAMSCWSMSGKDRIVKIWPVTQHSNFIDNSLQYPPGQGIPQWKLIEEIPFMEVGTISNYPTGRFDLNW